jgi:hypothetical protein
MVYMHEIEDLKCNLKISVFMKLKVCLVVGVGELSSGVIRREERVKSPPPTKY